MYIFIRYKIFPVRCLTPKLNELENSYFINKVKQNYFKMRKKRTWMDIYWKYSTKNFKTQLLEVSRTVVAATNSLIVCSAQKRVSFLPNIVA